MYIYQNLFKSLGNYLLYPQLMFNSMIYKISFRFGKKPLKVGAFTFGV
jgi:hypothetical protein